MDVSLIGGNDYQMTPPSPSPGSGEFISESAVEIQSDAQVSAEVRPDARSERSSDAPDVLRRAVNEINSSLAMYRRHLGIRHHEATNRNIVTVYDSDTNEVIREIPPESVLEAHANMLEMAGLFVDTRG